MRDNKLSKKFYTRRDVSLIAKELIGKKLFTTINGETSGGIIVETEAYSGAIDRASHAFPVKKTKRTEVMFKEGGHAYVYLCYGIHKLFNIVTNIEGQPDAVLIRAIEPTLGLDIIKLRRKENNIAKRLSSGPGNVSNALGIELLHYGMSLLGDVIWLENSGQQDFQIKSTKRIGVDYAGEDALRLWRFYMKNNPWVSKFD